MQKLVGFQQVTSSSCSKFLKFSQYCCESSIYSVNKSKNKKINIFLHKKKIRKTLFSVEIE